MLTNSCAIPILVSSLLMTHHCNLPQYWHTVVSGIIVSLPFEAARLVLEGNQTNPNYLTGVEKAATRRHLGKQPCVVYALYHSKDGKFRGV